MRHFICLVLILVAAGPATKPATKPTSRPSSPDVAKAQADLAGAENAATQEYDRSPAGKSQIAEVAALQNALETARESGSPQERLDASSAFNRARLALDDGRAQARKTSKAILSAQMKLVAARSALARAEADEMAKESAAKAAQDEKDRPMFDSIRKHEVIRGMSVEQVKMSLNFGEMGLPAAKGRPGTWFSEHEESTDSKGNLSQTWRIFYDTSTGVTTDAIGRVLIPSEKHTEEMRVVRVNFKNGFVTEFSQRRSDTDNEPTNQWIKLP